MMEIEVTNVMSDIQQSITALRTQIASRVKCDHGAGLAEYGLLLLFIAIVCVGVLTTLGTTISGVFTQAAGMFN